MTKVKNTEEEITEPELKTTELNPIWGFILIGVLLILFLKAMDWGFLKSEITEYPVQCREKVSLNRCNIPEFTLNTSTYKVLPNRQEVLHWSEVDNVPQKLTKCAVRNRKNWSCKYNDESAEFGFAGGKFWNRSNPSMVTPSTLEADEKTYYVSKFQWLNLQCKMSDDPYLLCMPIVILFN